jgi:uncharacterized SAM-binding protein YcdF (DUF218 family)/lysophospholipase L1-like esterase
VSAGRTSGRLVKGTGRLAASVVLGLVLIYATRLGVNRTSVADWLVSPLVVADSTELADAIVVAGAGVVGDCEPNHNGVQRVLLAARIWRQGMAPVVVFTGGTGRSCPVSVAMARLAAEVGVPRAAIWQETGSRSTRENAELSAPLLRGLGVRRVLVVTDRLHGARVSGAFRRMGFAVTQATVPIYSGHADNVSMLRAGMREYVALAYYRLRGWIGPLHDGGTGDHAAPTASVPPSRTQERSPVRNPDGPIAILGASYAAAWDPGAIGSTPVVNLGVAGQQSFEMRDRFERDVVPLHPQAVILWGFVNDIFRAAPGDAAMLARVRSSYVDMVALARQHGIVPVLATEVTVLPPRTWRDAAAGWLAPLLGKTSYQDLINRDVISINAWLTELSSQEGILLLDLHSTLAQAGGRRRQEFTTDDGSHITSAGYAALSVHARPILEEHLVARQSGF